MPYGAVKKRNPCVYLPFHPLFSALRGSEEEESMCVSSVVSPCSLPYGAGGGESMCVFFFSYGLFDPSPDSYRESSGAV